jgi:hypothetical protein
MYSSSAYFSNVGLDGFKSMETFLKFVCEFMGGESCMKRDCGRSSDLFRNWGRQACVGVMRAQYGETGMVRVCERAKVYARE